MRLSEPTTKIWMKIDPYYRRQKCRPVILVSGDKIYADIRRGSLEGASNDSGVIENVDFQDFWTLSLRHLRKWGQHYIMYHYLVPCRLSSDPKIYDLEWPWRAIWHQILFFVTVWLADIVRLRKIIAWKRMKVDTYCQQRKSPAWTLVSGNIRLMRIFAGVLWRGGIKDSGVIENVDFQRF